MALNPETADYWNGDERAFDSRSLAYRAGYNYYDGAPRTAYEHGTVFDRYDGDTVLVGGGSVVDGRRVTLVALDGDVATGSVDPVNLQVVPLSAPARTVSVTDVPGESVTLRLASTLPLEFWEDLRDGEPHVTAVACEAADPCGTVTVTLQQGVTYDLRLAKVGVGPGATEESGYYVTAAGGGQVAIPEGEARTLEVAVRDRFDNPASGVPVTFSTADGSFADADAPGERTVVTGEDGTASAAFQPVVTGSATVRAEAGDLGDDGTVPNEAHEIVVFDGLTVGDDEGDDNGDINPNEAGKVRLVRTSAVGGGGDDTVTLTFRSRTGGPVDVVGGRINFHSAGGPGASGGSTPTAVTIDGRSPALTVAGEFETFDVPITVGTADTTLQFAWDRTVRTDHFYVVTLAFSNGDTAWYFVAHPR